MENPYPLYYKWVHPNPKAKGYTILVKMQTFGQARFWEKKLNDWGPVDMDDLAETIDTSGFFGGAEYEKISEAEAEDLKARINAWVG